MSGVQTPGQIPDRDLIKRVIGLPGDTVEMRNKQLLVNGTVQKEAYTGTRFRQTPGATGPRCATHAGTSGPLQCRRTSTFMMGDTATTPRTAVTGHVAANPRERQGALSLLVRWPRRLASAGSHVPTDSLARYRLGPPNGRHVRRLSRELRNALLIALGVLSAGMGLHGFLLSSRFIDGGVTGVSMLLAQITPLPLPFWLPVVNLPFVAIGYRHIGSLSLRSVLAIAGLPVVLATVPYPDVTPDLVLTAVFGGFFIGAGIGLAVRGGAVLDGTEIPALLISKRSHLLKVGDAIGFNVVLFRVAMSTLGFEAARFAS